MHITAQKKNWIIWLLVAMAVLFVFFGTAEEAYGTETPVPASAEALSFETDVYGKTGLVATTALNLRSGPGAGNTSLGLLTLNEEVQLQSAVTDEDGKLWYHVICDGQSGYVSAEFIVIQSNAVYEYDPAFEAALDVQGFPESYKPYLRDLHAKYPTWVFQGARTGLQWSDAVAGESRIGGSLVASASPSSWKSMEKGAYDFSKGAYVSFDSGGWVTASRTILEHYIDPRNFINEIGIFQFLTHSFDEGTQTREGLQAILNGTFMEGEFPEEGYETYADALLEAGRQANVNPYVLASMIIVEQGSSGKGGCISGTVSGYEGYYNYFNIGAYKSGSMSAVERGVWYASGSGSYGRPWNSHFKSILGGALFYGQSYVEKNKNTLYFKKWNMMNGLENVGIGQYMTNIQGAESEAAALRKGYLQVLETPMVFLIPIYENMPEAACAKPSSGNNNYFLADLTVDGYTLTPEFDRYQDTYELVVDPSVTAVTVGAKTSSSSATVTGAGRISLVGANTEVTIVVTSSSGVFKTYRLTISKMAGGQQGVGTAEPTLSSGVYQFDTVVSGITERTSYSDFIGSIQVTNGSLEVRDDEGSVVTSGNVGTGMTLTLRNLSGDEISRYGIIVKGDLNGDGKINSVDPLTVQRHIIGTKELTGAALTAGDINGDGRVNSLDVLYIQKHIVGSYEIS